MKVQKINNIKISKNLLFDNFHEMYFRDGYRQIVKNLYELIKIPGIDLIKKSYFGLPIIIVGSGPSIYNDIEWIKKNRNNYIILSIDSIFNFLIDNQITPDFIIGTRFEIKGSQKSFHIIEVSEYEYTDKNFKNKICYVNYNKERNVYLKLLQNKGFLPSFKSVFLKAIYIALLINSKQIVIAGNDMNEYSEEVKFLKKIMSNYKRFIILNKESILSSFTQKKIKINKEIDTLKIKIKILSYNNYKKKYPKEIRKIISKVRNIKNIIKKNPELMFEKKHKQIIIEYCNPYLLNIIDIKKISKKKKLIIVKDTLKSIDTTIRYLEKIENR